MLRIDADRGKSDEHAAGTAVNGRGEQTFQPNFQAFHENSCNEA